MRTEVYETWTKAEMIETLEARGYKRVSKGWSKGRLVAILVGDDEGRVDERAW